MTQLHLIDHVWIDNYGPGALAAMSGRTFTSDDVREVIAEKPANNALYGVLFAKWRCAGKIEEVGRVRSKRPEANGRKISAWRIVQ